MLHRLLGSLNAALSWHIHNGLSLLATYVNEEVGGIRLANGTKRRLQITLVDDAAQEDAVKAISTSMLRGLLPSVPRVDFLLGPYSSSLSAVASKLAHECGAQHPLIGQAVTHERLNALLREEQVAPPGA